LFISLQNGIHLDGKTQNDEQRGNPDAAYGKNPVIPDIGIIFPVYRIGIRSHHEQKSHCNKCKPDEHELIILATKVESFILRSYRVFFAKTIRRELMFSIRNDYENNKSSMLDLSNVQVANMALTTVIKIPARAMPATSKISWFVSCTNGV